MSSSKGYQKPLPGQQIDWTHPLARGLTACFAAQPGNILMRDLTGNPQNNLANNNGVTLVNAVSPGQYPWDPLFSTYPQGGNVGNAMNPSAQFVSASSQYLSGTGLGLHTGNIDWTLYLWSLPASTAAQMMYAAIVGAANADREFQIYTAGGSNTAKKIDWWTDGVGHASNLQTPDTFVVAGHWACDFWWHDSGAGTINYQGYAPELGFDVGTIYSAAAVGGNIGAGTFVLGRQGDFSALYWNGIIDNVQLRKRVLTQDERTYLARNPYCFFEPTVAFRKYYSLGGGAPTAHPTFQAIIIG